MAIFGIIMIKKWIILIFFISSISPTFSDEIWECDGFKSMGDGSRFGESFVLNKTDTNIKFVIYDLEMSLKYLGTNASYNYDIYIPEYGSLNAFYFLKPNKKTQRYLHLISYESFLEKLFNGGVLSYRTKCNMK